VAFAKVALAALVMAVVVWAGERWLEDMLPGTAVIVKLLRVAVGIGLGLGALALAARALRIAEFDDAIRVITAKFVSPGPTQG
jgi:peptidoglycan biosynthesis protein MviN/MurJ (putative lipid II flippase)